jgi:hypothetical protein
MIDKTMAEPFQIFASALTTAEFALKLYHSLSTFVVKAKNADVTERDLATKAQRLRRTIYAVQLTLRVRIGQLQNQQPSTAEKFIWTNIDESLTSWYRMLRRFKKEMDKLTIRHGGQRMNWIDKTFWQLKHDRKRPTLDLLQSGMSDTIQELSLSLQCLDL